MKGLRLAFLLAAFGLAACGRAPTSPPSQGSPPVATASDFAGTWEIEFQVEQCSGYRHCFSFIGGTRTVMVRVLRSGDGYEGVFVIGSDAIDVRGSASAAGELTLHGLIQTPFPNAYGSFDLELMDFRASMTPQGLSGTVAYRIRGMIDSGTVSNGVLGGRIVRAQRKEAGADFSGTWGGRMAVWSCASAGSSYCYPEERHYLHPLELQLTQSGTQASGTMKIRSKVIPVSGTVSGAALTLTGSTPSSGGATILTSFLAQRDKLGRLKGTFSYTTSAGAVLSTTYDHVELWSVVLR